MAKLKTVEARPSSLAMTFDFPLSSGTVMSVVQQVDSASHNGLSSTWTIDCLSPFTGHVQDRCATSSWLQRNETGVIEDFVRLNDQRKDDFGL